MKNIKQFFTYLVVGALVIVLSISCKSNEEPTDETHSNHPPSGIYQNLSGETATVTSEGGTCNISGTGYNANNETLPFNITITKWSKSKNSSTSIFYLGFAGEATIHSPDGATYFQVEYSDDGMLGVVFQVNNVSLSYGANALFRQE